MHKRRLLFLGFILLAFIFRFSPQVSAQNEIEELFSVTVRGGFDTYFRPNTWTPVHIRVENNGPTVRGRFVVRPATTGSSVANTFSTPVDLSTNTTQEFFLYMVARGNANLIRLELLDDNDSVITSRDFNLRPLQPRDALYVLVSDRPRINLTTVNVGGYFAYQTNWAVDDIPDEADALKSVNMILINDVDSSQLTLAQQRALEHWVTTGGHLIVTGGGAWQETTTNLEDLIPFVPSGSTTSNDMKSVIELAGDYNTEFVKEFVITEGDVKEGATVLAQNEDGQPLIVRQQLGNGTVDFITIDPASSSIRNWQELPNLWFTLVTSTDMRPSWSYGLSQWDNAASAIEIMPGLDLLPPALTLAAFLVAYLVLIGPLNYFVLNRLNRLEYAWFTLPAFIVIFSVLAWLMGFEIRGDKVIMSRIAVVQSWVDADDAHMDQLLGLLAPRRGEYGILLEDERLLRPFSESVDSTIGISASELSTIEIYQGNTMEAVDFPLDASFIAAFYASGVLEKPDISGSAVFTFNEEENYLQLAQGVARNNSDITLEDAVILASGQVVYLEEPLEPGDIFTFDAPDVIYQPINIPSPSSMEYAAFTGNPFYAVSTTSFRGSPSYYINASNQSVEDIMGKHYEDIIFSVGVDDVERKEQRRRQSFLEAFVVDQFAATSRGDQVYLLGWSNDMPTTEIVAADEKETFDSTLYIIELEAERPQSSTGRMDVVTSDRFTWVTTLRDGVNDVGPIQFSLQPENVISFRYTPLPDAVLQAVDELTIFVDRSGAYTSERTIEVWNWQDEVWETMVIIGRETVIPIPDPEPYLGPLNAVQIRLSQENAIGPMGFLRVSIEQRGSF